MKKSFIDEFTPGDLVILKNNRDTVYKLLYIIGNYGKCRDQIGSNKHVRLAELSKHSALSAQ